MEKVHVPPWRGQPSDRGRLKNRTEHLLSSEHGRPTALRQQPERCLRCGRFKILSRRIQFLLSVCRGTGSSAQQCDERVCLSVRLHISRTESRSSHVNYGSGSVLRRRRCDTSFTSGFTDDATFAQYGPQLLWRNADTARTLLHYNTASAVLWWVLLMMQH